jgi:zinc protease
VKRVNILGRILVYIASTYAISFSAFAFEPKAVTSPGGITAWLVEDHSLPLVSFSFAWEGGASADEVGKDGTATFMTSLLNEGAESFEGTAFQARSEELAIRMGFSTSSDNISGWMQTLTVNQAEAAKLLRLALSKPLFADDAIARIRQELDVAARSAMKDPGSMAFARAAAIALPGHPYSRFSRGTPETIARITREDILGAHKLLIRRTGLTVSTVGNITPEELGKLLDSVFGTLPDTPPPPSSVDVVMKDGPILEVIPYEGPQTLVLFGQQGMSDKDPAYFATNVMMELLGGRSPRSWLSAEVREKRGLTYGIDYGNNPMAHAAFLAGSFMSKNESAASALEVVRSTIQRMASEGPSEKELADIKTFMTGSYALRFDSTSDIAEYLTALQMTDRPMDFANRRNSLIEAVTGDDIRAVAKRLLKPDKMIVVAVGQPVGLTGAAVTLNAPKQ